MRCGLASHRPPELAEWPTPVQPVVTWHLITTQRTTPNASSLYATSRYDTGNVLFAGVEVSVVGLSSKPSVIHVEELCTAPTDATCQLHKRVLARRDVVFLVEAPVASPSSQCGVIRVGGSCKAAKDMLCAR